MNSLHITHCPGTLVEGHSTYSTTCLRRVFDGRQVHHVLPYHSPSSGEAMDEVFDENRKRISISGVQEKFSAVLEKNKLRLSKEAEPGMYILKPIPSFGKNREQMPANEHLTMQLARQVFEIETAENALIFFSNNEPAYITKRFDRKDDGVKWAVEDFASISGRTPQTHGQHFKYLGNYLELFELMKKYLPAYRVENAKLFRRILFNYLFSNGDAHVKNFSVIQTEAGDSRLSPAYDMLNTRMHVDDSDFALEGGLLPRQLAKGKAFQQFRILADRAELTERQMTSAFDSLLANEDKVETLVNASFLDEKYKRSYLQAYQTRLKKLQRS